jgi:glutaredoxin
MTLINEFLIMGLKEKNMIEIYYSDTCPYCKKVLNFLNENNIKHIAKDVSIPENYDKLMELGKISQVPFMSDPDNNVVMYESDKIIEYAIKQRNKDV